MKTQAEGPNSAIGGTSKGLSKLAIPARIHLGTTEAQSQILPNAELSGSLNARGSPLTKVNAKGSIKGKKALDHELSKYSTCFYTFPYLHVFKSSYLGIEETDREHINHELQDKIDEKAYLLQNEIDDLENQTRTKMVELERLFKGAGFDSLGSQSLESIELRLDKIVNKANRGK